MNDLGDLQYLRFLQSPVDCGQLLMNPSRISFEPGQNQDKKPESTEQYPNIYVHRFKFSFL